MSTPSLNICTVSGKLLSDFTFSHVSGDVSIYSSILAVRRESGTIDNIPIMCANTCSLFECTEGQYIKVQGQLRVYNTIGECSTKSRIIMYAISGEILEAALSSDINIVSITGTVCKPVKIRMTSRTQKPIVDIMIAAERDYNKADYLHCVGWNSVADRLSTALEGDVVSIFGRVQSREYKKVLDSGELSSCEVVEIAISKCSSDSSIKATYVD